MKKFLLFFSMFLMFNIDVEALGHLRLEKIDGVYSSQSNMDNGSYFSSNQKRYYMDDRIVYCVEPGINIMTMEYDSSFDLSDSMFSSDIIEKISLIGHFGYDYPGHQSDKFFLAAQELIWETIGNNEVHFTTGINDTGDIVNIDFEKNEIMSLVNRFNLKPSFDNFSFKGIYGDELVLVDKNNVLSFYDLVSSNNDISINGDELSVKLSSLGDDKVILKRKSYDNLDSIFYSASNSQNFMFLRSNVEMYSSINLSSYIPYSRIDIFKSGDLLSDFIDSKFIFNEGGLSSIKFGVFAADDIYSFGKLIYKKDEKIEEVITVDGVCSSSLLPNGDYYLMEMDTLDEFILDDSKIYISLRNSGEEVHSYMVDLKNYRKRIYLNLVKHGQFFDKIVDNDGIYFDGPLEGVKFGLYTGSDIYNSSGKLIVPKNSLIKTMVTGIDGSISEKLDIPFGTYYLKEISTFDGYKLDTNIYEFSVAGDVEDIEIMISKEPLVNEFVKGKLIINKIDENGNRLEGSCFKLFDSSNNLIYEGCTDSNGVVSIDNLPYGKYYFYEVSAPSGYLLSNKVYEVNVIDDNSLIQVNVLNVSMPKTSDIYAFPRIFSAVGLGFGVVSLSLAIIYDKKNKDY